MFVEQSSNFYRIRKIINTKNGKVYQYQFVIVSINGKKNDFTGKTVIPFFTSASNTLGNSCEILENIVEGGK